ncbi:MAG: FKBP-type peptidyl-prolyl cis-trans isomerase [Planctomycetes bacterium]|nr:FKBP-type peptidyl-prolyl cis-trans isomerase [Planctomycetota bacterium]
MKKSWPLAAVVFLAGAAVFMADAQDEKKAEPKESKAELKTLQDQVSYGIGMNLARQFPTDQFKLNPAMVARALADAQDGKEAALSQEQLQSVFAKLQTELQKAQEMAAENNLKKGKEFLAKNAKKKGIKTTKSGLQYEVITAGKGASPAKESRVYTHYKGRLISGKVFDGSYKGNSPESKDTPIDFQVTGVIAGWTEALQLMKPGAHWRLYIPSELAYKERGSRGAIGPNEVLIFDIHLIKFE